MSPSTQVPRPNRASEAQLLARLGLTGSASDDQVEAAYDEITAFLADVPSGLRGWAAARLADADEAYVLLRGPGAGASALDHGRGGDLLAGEGAGGSYDDEPFEEDLAPEPPTRRAAPPPRDARPARNGNHARAAMLGDALGGGEWYETAESEPRPKRRGAAAGRAAAASRQVVTRRRGRLELEAARRGSGNGRLRRIGIGAGVIVALGAVLLVGYQLGRPTVPALTGTPVPQVSGPVVDQAKVTEYMTALAANDKDVAALQGLANLYFGAGDFATASVWFDKLLAVDPDNISALLGAGAAAYNAGDLAAAESDWKKVVELEPDNAEVHYDLGFLYLAKEPVDLELVRQEWQTVVDIDPDSEIAKTVAAHLDSLAPAASGAPGSPAPGSPAPGSAAPGSPAPVASPVPSPQPSAGS